MAQINTNYLQNILNRIQIAVNKINNNHSAAASTANLSADQLVSKLEQLADSLEQMNAANLLKILNRLESAQAKLKGNNHAQITESSNLEEIVGRLEAFTNQVTGTNANNNNINNSAAPAKPASTTTPAVAANKPVTTSTATTKPAVTTTPAKPIAAALTSTPTATTASKPTSTTMSPAAKLAELEAKAAQAKAAEAKSSAANSTPSASGHYTVAQLKGKPIAGLDWANREKLLSDAEFHSVFGMDKAAFEKLAGWKKQELKKKHGLF